MSINAMLQTSKEKIAAKEREKYGECLIHFVRVWKMLGFSEEEIVYFSGYYIKICQTIENETLK